MSNQTLVLFPPPFTTSTTLTFRQARARLTIVAGTMSVARSGPIAQPVKLGLSTARTQYKEITPWAAFREIPDNVMGMAATTGNNSVVAYIEPIASRKGVEAPVEGRMLVMATQTTFDLQKFKEHLSKVDPRAGGDATHANSVHGQGTSNASIGLGRDDLTGQAMIVRREARSDQDPVRSYYPVKQSVVRFGNHANHQYQQQSGDTGRATLSGDLMVYPDARPSATVPFMGSFVAYSDAPEPPDVRTYTAEVLNALSGPTQSMLLDDTKWAVDPDEMPAPRDLCDSLIKDVHTALKHLADATLVPYEEIASGDAVVYFFWDLRDEVDVIDGKLCVDGIPACERMTNAYLPHHSPTRALLTAKTVRMPDPMTTTMVFQGDTVNCDTHWVSQRMATGNLVRVVHNPNARGPKRFVYEGEGFAVESYTQDASAFLNDRRPDATVVLHMLGGLAVGEASGYMNGEVMLNAPKHRACVKSAHDLDAHGKTNSLKEWLGKDDSNKEHKFSKAFTNLVPDTPSGAWCPDETHRVRRGIKDLVSMGQENAKLSKDEAKDAFHTAQAQWSAWKQANSHATNDEISEKAFELHCRAGGHRLETALKQIAYMLTGCGIVHLVTIFSDDIAVNKPKTTILNETPTTIRICEALPRLNVEIMCRRIQQLSDWRAADLATAKKAAREAKEAAAAQKLADEKREKEAAKALRAAELRKHSKDVLYRMKQLGCAPKYMAGNTEVAFLSNPIPGSGQKGEIIAATMSKAHAERKLRNGTLVLPKGRAAGKALVFAGDDPTEGHLFHGRGRGATTEIIINPVQPPPPRPKPSARSARSQESSRSGKATILDAVAVDDDDAPAGEDVPVIDATKVEPEAEQNLEHDPEHDPEPQADPRPELGTLFKWDDEHASRAEFRVPLDSPPSFVEELTSNAHDHALLAFTRAVALTPQLQKCFANDEGGGMPIGLERDQRAVARVVPVVAVERIDRDGSYKAWCERLSDGCTTRVTIYMDVMRIANGVPNGISKTLVDGWLAHKLAHWTALVYVKALSLKPASEMAKALVGSMLSGPDSVVDVRDPRRRQRVCSMHFVGAVLDTALGKRKASDTNADAHADTGAGVGVGRATRPRLDLAVDEV